MTKTAFAALVLVILSVAILVAWSLVPPSTNLFDFGTETDVGAQREQAEIGVPEPGLPSQKERRGAVAESTAIGSISPANSKNPAVKNASSISRSAKPKGIEQLALADSDDEQVEGLAISGRVQDEEGYPLANIEVVAKPIRLFDVDEEETEPTPKEARSVFSNYDGYYGFVELADGEYMVHTVAKAGLSSARITARAGATSVNLMPAWLREIQVSGIVKDTDESPLEAVRVTSGSTMEKTQTGPDGYYHTTISVRTGAERHAIDFKRKGFRDQKLWLDSDDLEGAFTDVSLDVTLEPLKGLTTVTGRLKDPDGRPIAMQVVYLRSRGLKSKYSALSDNKGLFTVEDVEPGNDYKLLIPPKTKFRDYEKNQLEIPKSGLDLQIVLEPFGSGEFSGWLIDPEGNQVSGYKLTARHEQSIQQSLLVTSDHEGFFSVEEFPEGPVRLGRDSAPRFTITGIRASSKAQESAIVVLDLGRHVIQGLVKNRRGDPVISREVVLTWRHRENAVQSDSRRSTISDANGGFEFAGIGVGQHTLEVKAPGYGTAEVTINVGMDPANIVVELEEES